MVDKITFFNDYWSALEAKGWESLILHSWQNLPEDIPSDVDYAVSGVRPGELLRFLAEYRRKQGWLLAQVIEHEHEAYFCLCVRPFGKFESVALDVTWDYKRLGHFLVGSELLFKNKYKPADKAFFVTSPEAEFSYVLAKAAAKGKPFEEIKDRIGQLLKEDAAGCITSAQNEYGCKLPEGNGDGKHRRAIEKWYDRAPCFKGVRKGKRYGMNEIRLYTRRMLNPTGYWLTFPDVKNEDPWIEDICKLMPPLFRQQHRMGCLSCIKLPSVLLKLVRTRLVVEVGIILKKCQNSRLVCKGGSRELVASEVIGLLLRDMARRIDIRIESM